MTMLSRKTQLLAKAESVEGTFETGIAAADGGIQIYDLKFGADFETFIRNPQRATLSQQAPMIGAGKASVAFKTELKGSGAAGTAPKYGALLKSCGFAETVVAATSVAYAPASASIPSLSLKVVVDGVAHKLAGARGNVKLGFVNGQPGFLEFSFEGVYAGTEDLASVAGITYDTTDPVPFMAANCLSFGDANPVVTKLDLDMGNKLGLRPNANSANGYVSAQLTDRDPSFSLDPEMTTVAAYDWFGKLKAGTLAALTLTLGATAGNIVTISAPKCYVTKIDPGDRNGNYIANASGVMAMTAGDDEMTITLT